LNPGAPLLTCPPLHMAPTQRLMPYTLHSGATRRGECSSRSNPCGLLQPVSKEVAERNAALELVLKQANIIGCSARISWCRDGRRMAAWRDWRRRAFSACRWFH